MLLRVEAWDCALVSVTMDVLQVLFTCAAPSTHLTSRISPSAQGQSKHYCAAGHPLQLLGLEVVQTSSQNCYCIFIILIRTGQY